MLELAVGLLLGSSFQSLWAALCRGRTKPVSIRSKNFLMMLTEHLSSELYHMVSRSAFPYSIRGISQGNQGLDFINASNKNAMNFFEDVQLGQFLQIHSFDK